MPTPSPIIETPPTAPIASPRFGDALNQVRSRLASSAHTLSEQSPIANASSPSSSICACTWPAPRSTNCGSTAAKIMNAFGFDTPTTKPCRTARGRDSGAAGASSATSIAATVPDRLHAEVDEVRRAEPASAP